MTLVAFALVLIGVLLNALAQLALKASVSSVGTIDLSLTAAMPAATRLVGEPWLWLGLGCYGVSVVVWILALSRVEVSIAYPMLSIGYVVNAVAAWLWLGESMSLTKVVGIGIIMLGVLVLARA
ncbi:MAG: 4-amino-4-deoxy-L-arabinose transferase [Sphingobacteriia bacterium]|nr:4-amino-4-deoxy-L-arabinose transferase [Sphingobacteriia bacterium]NCC39510.1 4-amino-4-deoxy-L-arabinose transferase [Gammaproteobacteria bacterium]